MEKPYFLRNRSLQLLLFGGKGGVGKTTSSVATALNFARRYPQESFLVISTDPAHSLYDCLAGYSPPRNLEICELDTRECLVKFKENHDRHLREIASKGTFLDEDDINQFLNLSMPGMDELMAFIEISEWVEERSYDCIIVDTSPTGHTLRMVNIPKLIWKWLGVLDALMAKHRYMKHCFGEDSQRNACDHFLEEFAASVKRMESTLQDPIRCRFVPVMHAEAMSIHETAVLIDELEQLKIPITELIINKLHPKNRCQVCLANHIRQTRELKHLPRWLSGYSLWGVPVYPREIRRNGFLDSFWDSASAINCQLDLNRKTEPEHAISRSISLSSRVEGEVGLPSPEMTLLLFAGKGGVGKTTLACATALQLTGEWPDKEIFLFSTDPAHSLSTCLGAPVGSQPIRISPGLTAMEIDAQAEFDSLKTLYQKELNRFINAIAHNFDLPFDRTVMEKVMDLSPPGIDEAMALTQIMEFLSQGRYDVFILDSAPTGHLIRLLELPELLDQWLKAFFNLFLKYKRIFRLPNITERLIQMSKDLKLFRALLRDPTRSALYGVATLTEMAFQETKDLVAACERMEINVPMLFLNLATPESDCPLCSAQNLRELQVRGKFQCAFSGIHQTLVYRQNEPRGLKQLGNLGKALYPYKRAEVMTST